MYDTSEWQQQSHPITYKSSTQEPNKSLTLNLLPTHRKNKLFTKKTATLEHNRNTHSVGAGLDFTQDCAVECCWFHMVQLFLVHHIQPLI